MVWATRFRVVPLCCPQWFRALVRLRSMGTGQLLNAGGAFDEFTGGVQFLIEFRFVEESGGVQPLMVCWGHWKNCWGGCLPCCGGFCQFPVFDPLGVPWLPNMLWMILLNLVASIAFCFISSYPVRRGGFITSVAMDLGSPQRKRLVLSLFPAVYSARRSNSSKEET